MTNRLYVLLILFIIYGCSETINENEVEKKDTASYNKLFREAGDIFSRHFTTFDPDEDTLRKALFLINEAIKIDSLSLPCYSYKLNIEMMLQDYPAAIKTQEKLIELTGNEPFLIHYAGVIHEKNKNLDSAYIQYKKSVNLADSLILLYPDSLDLQVQKAYFLLFIGEKDKAFKSISELSYKNPENVLVNQYWQIINTFEREELNQPE